MSGESLSFKQKAALGVGAFGLVAFIGIGAKATYDRSSAESGGPTRSEREVELINLANRHNIQVSLETKVKNGTEFTLVRLGEHNDDCMQMVRLILPRNVIEFLPTGPDEETYSPDQAIGMIDQQFQDCN